MVIGAFVLPTKKTKSEAWYIYMMQRGGFIPEFMVDTLLMKRNGAKYEPVFCNR